VLAGGSCEAAVWAVGTTFLWVVADLTGFPFGRVAVDSLAHYLLVEVARRFVLLYLSARALGWLVLGHRPAVGDWLVVVALVGTAALVLPIVGALGVLGWEVSKVLRGRKRSGGTRRC